MSRSRTPLPAWSRALVLACLACLAVPAAAAAHPLDGTAAREDGMPLNDLFAIGQGSGQPLERVGTQKGPEPSLDAAPQAPCSPGSRPEPGVQGRVPAGSASNGLWCNVTLLGRHGVSGGFKVLRYQDRSGRECAYYDTALLFPLNVFKADATSLGVVVLDMSDPGNPVQTDRLIELPMLSPHESLVLNPERGLIAAVLGNPTTYPGLVSIYDASEDCRHPRLRFTGPVARLGHESGFSPDGRTFYAASTATASVTAIDVTNPRSPSAIWQGQVTSHGLSLSDDGTRAYVADPGGELLVLDTSEIQERRPTSRAREVSRLTWERASIPQNAIPFTRDGRPYLLEIDEYTAGTAGGGARHDVGAARIIDISDETQPRSIANLRLEVNQPAEHAAAAGDPGAGSPVQGYAAHYCALSSRVDPTVVACSFIASGLRVFDISDLTRPKEIAYFVAPTQPRVENGFQPSSFAMSQPVVVPERREVWYSDGTAGFYAVRVDEEVWPATPAPATTRRRAPRMRLSVRPRRVRPGCHRFTFRTITRSNGRRRSVRGATVRLGGRRVRTRRGGYARARVCVRRPGRIRAVARKRGHRRAVAVMRVLRSRD